jgi:hypothetical protein
MSANVHSNMVMIALQDLIETPFYKKLNVAIHHQWTILFSLNINSNFETQNHDNSSFDNSNSENEKKHYKSIDSMIYVFLEAPKIMDYDNTIYYIAPCKHFHPVSLF